MRSQHLRSHETDDQITIVDDQSFTIPTSQSKTDRSAWSENFDNAIQDLVHDQSFTTTTSQSKMDRSAWSENFDNAIQDLMCLPVFADSTPKVRSSTLYFKDPAFVQFLEEREIVSLRFRKQKVEDGESDPDDIRSPPNDDQTSERDEVEDRNVGSADEKKEEPVTQTRASGVTTDAVADGGWSSNLGFKESLLGLERRWQESLEDMGKSFEGGLAVPDSGREILEVRDGCDDAGLVQNEYSPNLLDEHGGKVVDFIKDGLVWLDQGLDKAMDTMLYSSTPAPPKKKNKSRTARPQKMGVGLGCLMDDLVQDAQSQFFSPSVSYREDDVPLDSMDQETNSEISPPSESFEKVMTTEIVKVKAADLQPIETSPEPIETSPEPIETSTQPIETSATTEDFSAVSVEIVDIGKQTKDEVKSPKQGKKKGIIGRFLSSRQGKRYA